ncbi:RIO1 family regulatory kinase/ATPase [Cystobacter ferrugineus]|uniref:non-specific serine/threonine protein kinase n=1 Tax=Cystobacter ferrugineus TaxID=83449 RepID=A0A1L9BGB7_9BACT|nr:RIO1 family regulatory kinase/ATPase [Cystobacter ferrugineus]OJH41300.1 hypothetical protein BON30_10530 [Cystobacter ferrugineus]
MNEALQVLLTDGVIDEVVGRLKSGKEADVYLVRHGGEVVAAKIYKEREHRNFRNNSGYREGRQVRNSRTARAIAKGSRFGVAAAEEAWKTAEVEALFKLHAAGVCVPRPVMFYEGVLLMELVLDLEGHPAPRLEEAQLTPEEASALYFDLRNQAIRMLCCDLIHGDLSAFNILLGNRGATIIDFPQVVGAAANSQAEHFFRRDIENLRRYFEAVDPSLRARAGDAAEIWRAYVKRELTPDFEPTGRFQGDPSRERRFSGGPRSQEGRGPRPPGDRPPRRDAEGSRPWREQAPREQQGQQQAPREQQGQQQGPREPRPPREARSFQQEQGPREPRPPREGQSFRDQRPPRGDRPPRGNGDAPRQPGFSGPRSSQPPGPRGRPMDRRGDRPERGGPHPGRGGSGPQVTYVQKNPVLPPSPAKPDDES